MRHHRLTARGTNPAYRLIERGPLAGHVAGLPARKKLLECLLHAADITLLDEKTRKMRARNDGPFRQTSRAFIGALDSFFLQPAADFHRAPLAELAQARKALLQGVVRGIDIKTDDMHRLALPRDGNFNARDQSHAQRSRRGLRLGNAIGHVMVGQRQHVHAGRSRPRHQLRRCEGSIRLQTVCVQIETPRGRNGRSCIGIAHVANRIS
jgi:hypothetical protein